MKRLLKPFKTTKAEGYIDTVVCVMAAMMVIVLALNIFSFLTLKLHMDHFAKEIIDVITTYGAIGDESNQRYNELCDETGISPAISYDGTEFFDSSAHIQLGDTITITLTHQTHVRGLGVFKIPVTLSVTHSGLSQRYWK